MTTSTLDVDARAPRRAARISRHRAAAIHLGISATIAVVALATMLTVWYPTPLFDAMGAEGLVFIMVGVDVLLGPLVTWIVFSPGKPLRLLRLDLAIIGTLQLAALAYGIHVIFLARPVYELFVRDRFEVTTASEVSDAELAKVTRPEFKTLPLLRPRLAAAVVPKDPQEQLRIMMSAAAGADLKTYPQHFVPYESQLEVVREKLLPIAELRKHHPEAIADIDAAVRDTGLPEAKLGFLPLRARREDMALLLDRDSARIVGYAKVDPW